VLHAPHCAHADGDSCGSGRAEGAERSARRGRQRRRRRGGKAIDEARERLRVDVGDGAPFHPRAARARRKAAHDGERGSIAGVGERPTKTSTVWLP
jgi:hypothetical protein